MKSQNKQVYTVFEYDNYSEKGLKKFMRLLENKGEAVASVVATNSATKKDGLKVKRATFFFSNQQKVEIIIGDAGDVVTLKVNGSPQPQQADGLNSFATNLVQLLKSGQDAFDKALKRRTDKIKIDKPKKAVASRTNKKRIAEAEAELEKAQAGLSDLRVLKETVNEDILGSKKEINLLMGDYETALTRNKTLKAELAQLLKDNK
jgi:hypothetical protein